MQPLFFYSVVKYNLPVISKLLLSRITIQNYAIIEDLEIAFSKSLNVLTGETGAGKSIIMGAMGLILGERADSGVLLNKTKKCVVEAVFQNPKKEIASFLLAGAVHMRATTKLFGKVPYRINIDLIGIFFLKKGQSA